MDARWAAPLCCCLVLAGVLREICSAGAARRLDNRGGRFMNQLVAVAARAPALVAADGAHASYRFFEFFTADIRNPHTRRAYARAATEFFDWLEAKGVTQITAIESVHVATYIEQLQRT